MVFSTFSSLPMPTIEWDERNMRYMMCFLPFIGLLIGVFILAWWLLCNVLAFGVFLRAVGLLAIPYFVTGGIHLDGFADVTDALSSHAEPERKREILKDPHIGAFAGMGIAMYLILYLGFATEVELSWQTPLMLCFMHALSRLSNSYSVLFKKNSSEEGMVASFRKYAASKRNSFIILAVQTVIYVGAMAFINLLACVLMVLGCVVNFLCVTTLAKRQFGGMSGDLAGCLCQTAELVMLVLLVLSQRLVIL